MLRSLHIRIFRLFVVYPHWDQHVKKSWSTFSGFEKLKNRIFSSNFKMIQQEGKIRYLFTICKQVSIFVVRVAIQLLQSRQNERNISSSKMKLGDYWRAFHALQENWKNQVRYSIDGGGGHILITVFYSGMVSVFGMLFRCEKRSFETLKTESLARRTILLLAPTDSISIGGLMKKKTLQFRTDDSFIALKIFLSVRTWNFREFMCWQWLKSESKHLLNSLTLDLSFV